MRKHQRSVSAQVLFIVFCFVLWAFTACDELEEYQVSPNEHIHVYGEETVIKPATCDKGGVISRTCTICGKKISEDIKATGHDWNEWVITKSANCMETGERTRTCRNDENHTEWEILPKSECVWGDWQETKAATCTAKGEAFRVCSVNPDHFESKDTPVLGHDYQNGICTRCGEEQSE